MGYRLYAEDQTGRSNKIICGIKDEFLLKENSNLQMLLVLDKQVEEDCCIFESSISSVSLPGLSKDFNLNLSPNTFCNIAGKHNIYANYFSIAVDKLIESSVDLKCFFEISNISRVFDFYLFVSINKDIITSLKLNTFYFGNIEGLKFSLPIFPFLDL